MTLTEIGFEGVHLDQRLPNVGQRQGYNCRRGYARIRRKGGSLFILLRSFTNHTVQFVIPRINPIRRDAAVMTHQAEVVNVWED